MNLEQIDTSTTAGKLEVMRLAMTEDRKVVCRESSDPFSDWEQCGSLTWKWGSYDYAIIAGPAGPKELWVVVTGGGAADSVWHDKVAAMRTAAKNDFSAIRYIRADLAGEVK